MWNAILRLRCVKLRVKVEQLAVTLQRLEAMGATFRDDQHARVLRGQLLGVPLQEGWRSGAQVGCDVPDAALDAANELHFRMRRMLKMHSAHRAGAGCARPVDLGNMSFADHGCQLARAKQPDELTAMIREYVRFDDGYPAYCRGQKLHSAAHANPASLAAAV